MPSQRPQLLVIDDEQNFRHLMRHSLQQHFQVSVSADGCDGYMQAVVNPPDAVLLDLTMPGWDGFRTLGAFRNHPRLKRIPILILSADESRATELATVAAGADGYLLKAQFTRDEVIRKVYALTNTRLETVQAAAETTAS